MSVGKRDFVVAAGRTVPIGDDHFCYTLHEPVGVVGLIIPWNLPLIAVAAKIGPGAGTSCCSHLQLNG